MSRNSLFILLVIFVIFVVFVQFFRSGRPSPVTVLAPQENSGGEVDIKVTPLVLKAGEKPQFEIEFNTHSIELDFNISQIASLTNDNGNAYTSSTWEGSPPGGHHREGTLTFSESLKETKSITLALLNISNVAKREFTWSL